MLDRFFDNYVMTPMQKIVGDISGPRTSATRAASPMPMPCLRPPTAGSKPGSTAAPGPPATTSPSPTARPRRRSSTPTGCTRSRDLHARCGYRARLLARPSFARAVDEARPYRLLFPPGAPDRD